MHTGPSCKLVEYGQALNIVDVFPTFHTWPRGGGVTLFVPEWSTLPTQVHQEQYYLLRSKINQRCR